MTVDEMLERMSALEFAEHVYLMTEQQKPDRETVEKKLLTMFGPRSE